MSKNRRSQSSIMKRLFVTGLIIFGMIGMMVVGCNSIYEVDAEKVVVVQTPDGSLTVRDTPGYKFNFWAKTTEYYKTWQFKFSEVKNESGEVVSLKDCLPTRFNDQGKGTICGTLTFSLPKNHNDILELHKNYHNMEGIIQKLVRPTTVKAAYNTGILMSSKESSGEKRGDILRYFREQTKIGVYQTDSNEVEVPDLLASPVKTIKTIMVPKKDKEGIPVLDKDGKPVMIPEAREVEEPATKRITVVTPRLGKDGSPLVQEESIASRFHVEMYDFTISRILYEDKVKKQIDTQRDMEMAVQTKIAEAKKAQQDVITAEEQGKAAAAKARWEQERIKTERVTKAEAARDVAALDLEAAKLEKQATVERAEGEAEAKELVMKADGALDKKLEALKYIATKNAEAVGKHKQTPDILIGNSGDGSPDSTVMMLQLLGLKAAKDLSLDMKVK